MQRYFINNNKSELTSNIQITGDDVHHISRVLRMTQGNKIVCCTKDGYEALCEIAEITSDQVNCFILEWMTVNRELPVSISIASGLPKGDKLEWIIQKGTELGASSFIPFNAARSIVKIEDKKVQKKLERWQKIAKEASEQSYRNKVPDVSEPLQFNRLLEISNNYDVKIVAYEETAKQGESKNLAKSLSALEEGGSLIAVFGPEGGLTEKEVASLEEIGFVTCSFGPRILRTETAPLYLLSAVSYYFELSR
ncbi:16S rRNA (uracil(1498)-N(3))-methyltransferase [Metabacillus niabensis]|uniref:Ribosomal RNA small subunit methyltransferase E n=1 Tax=Metabacillus niabensis TaxID=324854 RepID=A0ABT9YXV4_9BACI|nr:16S rRNA (uracil(1498)-N(3))-methyltransferase [Metabacillus niabensis]MDQ0224816.1 16S rRNA (uracil1498-N3)-methyltransferase [Metabacillus niabensis]PAD66841.1 16S rRNA (uracil(1498)-N(3))-methyltransferase [Bacillus sp. 7586-K]